MRYVAWSATARQDLEDIFNFYATKKPSIATKIHNLLLDEAERLTDWPEVGQRVEFINEQSSKHTFRSLVTSNGLYGIIYTFNDEYVAEARVWSCRIDPRNIIL